MVDNGSSKPEHGSGGMSRRRFVRLATSAAVLAGCGRAPEPAATPTAAPLATGAPPTATAVPPAAAAAPTALPAATAVSTAVPEVAAVPTATAAPTPAPAVAAARAGRPDIIKMFPEVPSVVVQTRHAGAWSGDALVPGALRQMLDASITRLTGLNDARAAWAALFRPEERIAIKVNTISGSSIFTHVPLVNAVVDSLVAAGIPAEQIFVYDRLDRELKGAGFTLNKDGPGARCVATGNSYGGDYRAASVRTRLSDVLTGSAALINMPVLKQHGFTGISFAMKNHYGTCNNPGALHGNIAAVLPGLNALPPIREKTRLIIGDALAHTLQDMWSTSGQGDTIFMSFDPVAQDAAALARFVTLKRAAGQKPDAQIAKAKGWLSGAAKLGLGTPDEGQMQVVEVELA